IIAVVVANSQEAAEEAAFKIAVDYEAQTPAGTFGDAGTKQEALADVTKMHEDPKIGDAQAAFAAAQVKIEAEYATPTQHHNAMELFDTTCQWSGEKLTILEASQFVHGLRGGVARQLGIKPDDIRVESRFVGGAFGSRGGVTARTALIALAAKRVKRA